jgi:hypothetical protein
MTDLKSLQDQMVKAQAAYLLAQHKYFQAQWRLFHARYDEYRLRAARFEEEHPGAQDAELWFREVRPLCRSCRMEITDPGRHTITFSWGELPEVTCDVQGTW